MIKVLREINKKYDLHLTDKWIKNNPQKTKMIIIGHELSYLRAEDYKRIVSDDTNEIQAENILAQRRKDF